MNRTPEKYFSDKWNHLEDVLLQKTIKNMLIKKQLIDSLGRGYSVSEEQVDLEYIRDSILATET